MDKPLTPNQSLALLDSLRQTVRELSARAARQEEELRVALNRERARRQGLLEEEKARLLTATNEVEVHYLDVKSKLDARHEFRKGWLDRAYHASKETVIQRVEDRIGARKYDMQKRLLQADREREANTSAAAAALRDFRAALATEQEALAALEAAAQIQFRGYAKFVRGFFAAYQAPSPEASGDHKQLLEEMRAQMTRARETLGRFASNFPLRLLREILAWIVLALLCLGLPPALKYFGHPFLTYAEAGAGAAVFIVAAVAIRFAAAQKAEPLAKSISESLARARRLHEAAGVKAEAFGKSEAQRIHDEYQAVATSADAEIKRAQGQAGEARVSARRRSDEKAVRAMATHERQSNAKAARIEKEHAEGLQQANAVSERRVQVIMAESEAREKVLQTQHEQTAKTMEAEWRGKLEPLYAAVASANAHAANLFPDWSDPAWAQWKPPAEFAAAARFGELTVDVEKLSGGVPKAPHLRLPGPAKFPLALSLVYPEQGSVLFETAEVGHEQAIGALNNIILRLLAVAPPGRLNFSILDPVGLGQNFAGVMHLADYEEQIINSRIWTQSTQIDQRLGELNEHMEKVIQMYLRNEYATIAEYNAQAGVIAEKYHFLVVADFPANFSDTAIKRLLSIAASGARCGVYMLLHWDRRLPLPQEVVPDELRKSCFVVTSRKRAATAPPGAGGPVEFLAAGAPIEGASLAIDAPPSAEQATEFIHEVGEKSRDSSRVEVPFDQVAPSEEEIWSEDTSLELRVPVGRTGATKLQYLAIGKGTRQHGLVAGKTGSGKSTLFHVIITNLALWCSPEQVEFYLVDFKKGVEFKCYAANRLPHARVVAIESDREFGLSVLQRVDDELKRRGEMFRKLGVQDIPGYKRAGGKESIPRTLLMIDEFQEFFIEDDKVAQTASLLLDRIVRQGRAFGIHVLLGSQTLGGAYTVARTTLGQMVIRVALQCNEADAYLIMDENNPAPRLLSRPGEGIYNDAAGAIEGNSPFQVVWLPDEVRERTLEKVRSLADRHDGQYPGPIVFEGNAPSDIRENYLLRKVLEQRPEKPPESARIWLGAPNSIKGPTEAPFHRQSGNNLLVVGQREEAALAIVSIGIAALAAQYPGGGARIILCDASAPDSPARRVLEQAVAAVPFPMTVAKPGDVPGILAGLSQEMKTRAELPDAGAETPVFLIIHGLQKFARLRYEEDFSFSSSEGEAAANPSQILNSMVCEGTRLGFHVIATCDTYNNVTRFLSRKAVSEFEMRVAFQMSATDSASLLDTPKASMLGLHRALFFNEQEGYLETFRPYAVPEPEWFEQIKTRLAQGQSATVK